MEEDFQDDVRQVHPLQISETYLKISAPMVRYSKLPFRELVRNHGVDLAYTPMILADVFKNSEISRKMEFKTYPGEKVIVQFAASNSLDAADAAQLVANHSSGVDINCGCPQKWAINEGIGSALLKSPETIADIVNQVKRRTSSVKMDNGKSFPCSIKIRIHEDISKTIELAKRAEEIGVDWITVHGRTIKQKNSDKVNHQAVKLIKESLSIPVFFNGDIKTLKQADEVIDMTGCDGIMAAQGLLENPAMFEGQVSTPWECIEEFIDNSIGLGTNHFIFHHHLMYMLDSSMTKMEKKSFNCLTSIPSVLDYMSSHYGLEFKKNNV